MASWTVATVAALSTFSQVLGTVGLLYSFLGAMLLLPPNNVTLLSKDFHLFLTWLPRAEYPPGVFYSVQWANVYNTWENFPPCTNISETACDITCTSPDLYHSFDVRVKAQAGAGTIFSAWVDWEGIDYTVDVGLAPPVLQVKKTGDTVAVNATFSDPLCLKDLFSDLTADLEFWEAGTDKRKKVSMNNRKDFDAAVFNGSNYCFSARANLNNVHSNFSEPTCVKLHSEASAWALVAVPVLLLFLLVVFIRLSLTQSKSSPVKSPQALDFSSLKCPKKFVEFTEKEFMNVLICPRHPVVVENWSRPIAQVHLQFIPAMLEEDEEEEEEEEDDTGGPRPYTEMHRFQKEDMHSQIVDLVAKEPDLYSESDNSQLGEGSMPDVMVPEFFVLTRSIGETTSRSQGSDTTSLSANSSSDKSSLWLENYPPSQSEGQEGLDEDTAFLLQLSDSNLPTRKLFVSSESFCEASCGNLGDPHISVFGVQNKEYFCDLSEDEELSENDSCGCETRVGELSPSKVPSRKGLENSVLGGNGAFRADSSPETKYQEYLSRHVHCLSIILPR